MQAQMGAGCCTSSQAGRSRRAVMPVSTAGPRPRPAAWGRRGPTQKRGGGGSVRGGGLGVGGLEVGKACEPPERAGLVESLGIQLDGGMGGVAAGAAGGVLLQVRGVRRAVA